MPGKNYTYAYRNIRDELEEIRNTLRHMQHQKISLTRELQELRSFELDEVMNHGTFEALSNLHALFSNIIRNLPNDPNYSLLKLRIERLDYPDLQNFIGDMKEEKGDTQAISIKEARQIVYQQEYNEEYGTIMRPYQLIDGELHPCRVERDGHVTLLGENSYLCTASGEHIPFSNEDYG